MDLRYLLEYGADLVELLDYGWSGQELYRLCRQYPSSFSRAKWVGSPEFVFLWQELDAERSLVILLAHLSFPRELTNDIFDNQGLLATFWQDLPPHDWFWSLLSEKVSQYFIEDSLSQESDLARKVHQLRYLLSLYQAQWVRGHYPARSDRESLAIYLNQLDTRSYSLTASARLHNKRKKSDHSFPDDIDQVNIKVLVDFHSEFILSKEGEFLTILDLKHLSDNALLNGASFNYATKTNKRHGHLDIAPVSSHDPLYRKKLGKGYYSPKRVGWFSKDWQASFYNKRGYFAQGKKSLAKCIKHEQRAFKKLITKSR